MESYPDEKPRFLQRHMKLLVGTALLIIILFILSVIPGVGYEIERLEVSPYARRRIVSRPGLVEGSAAMARMFNGTLQASLNPLLYPISYVTGDGYIVRKFIGAAEFWDWTGEAVKEMALLGTLTVQIAKNLPYFVVVGYALTQIFRKWIIPATQTRISKLQNARSMRNQIR